jgi:UDPglucose 6-dehydrogenase
LGQAFSCFPKDLSALIAFSKNLGYDHKLIEAAVDTNKEQWTRAIEQAKRTLRSLNGKRVAVLGLAFKPETDDMREAVSVSLIQALLTEGARVVVYDPAAIDNARRILGHDVSYARDSLECLEDADCCVIVTEWDEFRAITPNQFLDRLRCPVVIDGRRIYDADAFTRAGIRLAAIGLGPTAR